jgi:hypothetical protein
MVMGRRRPRQLDSLSRSLTHMAPQDQQILLRMAIEARLEVEVPRRDEPDQCTEVITRPLLGGGAPAESMATACGSRESAWSWVAGALASWTRSRDLLLTWLLEEDACKGVDQASEALWHARMGHLNRGDLRVVLRSEWIISKILVECRRGRLAREFLF